MSGPHKEAGLTGTNDTRTAVRQYHVLGWSLVGIPSGSKAPSTFGWQTKATGLEYWDNNPGHNVGLLHGLSGTCAIDIDHMENARTIFDGMAIDLDALLASAPQIIGRSGRGKAIFRAPSDTLTTRKISWPVAGDPRRTEVVFEFRAGTVQDVLPPSIHPDTGEPYRWAGRPIDDGLPDLPEQVLTIWREWDRFRPQMMDLCPWKPKPEFIPPPKKKRDYQKGESVIEAYNASTRIEDALEVAGYKRYGNRWLSPNSTTGIPGVIVFDGERAYSHHASDPFDPSHTFDAFDLFCVYQHLGSVPNAVKAAADILRLDTLPVGPSEEDREAQKHGAAVAAQIMKKEVARRDVETDRVPEHLLTVPGVLGQLVEYAGATAIKSQPQFDVQAALALGAVVLGQRFVTSGNNMASLFFMNVGKTGTGKEHANSVISRTLRYAGLEELLGPPGYTSEGGVLTALKSAPAHIAVIDEFGNYLGAAGNRSSANLQQALSMMMECFGRQTDSVQKRGYSDAGLNEKQSKALQVRIHKPSLTVLSMTTPETFYAAVSGRDLSSGLLNRFLIVESRLPRQRSRMPAQIDPPQAVIEWAQKCATAGQGGNLTDLGPEFPPDPVVVPFTDGALALLHDYEGVIIDRQNAANNETMAAMYNRSREIAMRVSLIVAVSKGQSEIDSDVAQWAIDYVDFYAQRAVQSMIDNMAEGETDELRKKVAAAIKAAGSSGMNMREIIRAVPGIGNLSKPNRDGLLAMVCEDFPVARSVSKPSGRGRPSIIHTWDED